MSSFRFDPNVHQVKAYVIYRPERLEAATSTLTELPPLLNRRAEWKYTKYRYATHPVKSQ